MLGALMSWMAGAPCAIADDVARPSDCHTRVILGLVEAAPPSDDTWVQELALSSGVQLHYLRAIAPGLYLVSMIAPNRAGGCAAAIERLRRDPRLRSAEIDQPRKHDSG
jgi:hypothetical protein